MLYKELSKQILDAAFTVHYTLGPGLLEQCYHNALFFELKAMGLPVLYNAPFPVYYRKQQVGEYYAELAAAGKVIIEVKSARVLAPEHTAQLLNYLHISGYKLGYLFNFQNTLLEFKRYALSS